MEELTTQQRVRVGCLICKDISTLYYFMAMDYEEKVILVKDIMA